MDVLAALVALFADPTMKLGLAGGAGGASRWLFVIIVDRKMAPRQALATILLGIMLGIFASPLAGPLMGDLLSGFRPDPEKMPFFVAYATGAGGIGVLGLIIDMWTILRKQRQGDAGVDPGKGDGP